jgi:hypothetical protein
MLGLARHLRPSAGGGRDGLGDRDADRRSCGKLRWPLEFWRPRLSTLNDLALGLRCGPAPAAPLAIVVRPIAPRPQVPDEPVVATWRDCMARALQTYEQSHNLHALQMATENCQVRLEEQDGEDYAGEDYGVSDGEDYGAAEPSVPLSAAPRNCVWRVEPVAV